MKPADTASTDATADVTADADRLDERRLDILVEQGASVRWQVRRGGHDHRRDGLACGAFGGGC